MPVSAKKVEETISQGAVYLMRHRTLTSPKLHFLIVMNEHPKDELLLVLHIVTSNIERVRKTIAKLNSPAYTAVDLSPTTETFLDRLSIVDCNDCKTSSFDDFVKDLSCPESKFIGKITAGTLEALITGTLASDRVSPAQKTLISRSRFAAIERNRLLPEELRSRIHIKVLDEIV